MAGIFGILEIGKRALRSHLVALNTTGHNVANANTPGFSRQEAIFMPTPTTHIMTGQVGTGVTIEYVRRVHDAFIDLQIQKEQQSLGQWMAKEKAFQGIEAIFAETTEGGLNQAFSEFWQSWQNLANNPENDAVRAVVRERGVILGTLIRHLHTQLGQLGTSYDVDIALKVERINTIAAEIRDLSRQIIVLEASSGTVANDYRDRREHLVRELSGLVNVTVREDEIGDYYVTISGRALVTFDSVYKLTAQARLEGDGRVMDVIWEDGSTVGILNGELKGLQEAQRVMVSRYKTQLDTLAATLIEEVNRVHRAGYGLQGSSSGVPTGNDFFSGKGAKDIDIAPAIAENLNYIAASKDGTPGNNANALAIAQLEQQKLLEEGSQTLTGYFSFLIGYLGTHSQEAINMRENQELLVQQLEQHRESISGVSLDEEMTKLIRYQHAYQAAAKVITVADEVIQSLIAMV